MKPVKIVDEFAGHSLAISRDEDGHVLIVCHTCRETLTDAQTDAEGVIVAIENHV